MSLFKENLIFSTTIKKPKVSVRANFFIKNKF